MQPRPRLVPLALALALTACAGSKPSASNPPDSETEAGTSEQVAADDGEAIAATDPVGTELPPELVAELRMQGSDENGRLLTLAPGFVATAECSDCGAPSYLWFLAVRCTDTRHCEVLTEQCEGAISREDDTYVVEFKPVDEAAAEVCAGYSGTFELP